MLLIIIQEFRLLQDLLINKKNYFEEGAFNGASSFLFCKCVLDVLFQCIISVGGFFYTLEPDTFIIHKLLGFGLSKMFLNKKMNNEMTNHTWKEIGIREKMQLFNGTVLVLSAIILYFVAFIITFTIGFEVVSAGATLLATGLAFFGITSFVKNQMVDFEARMNDKIKKMEKDEQVEREDRKQRYEDSSDNIADDEHNA